MANFSSLISMTRGFTCFHRNPCYILLAVPLFIVPTITAPIGIAPKPLTKLTEANNTFNVQRSLTPRSNGLSNADWGGIAAIVGILGVIVAIVGIIITYLAMPKQKQTRREVKESARQNGRDAHRVWYGQVKGLFGKKRPRLGIWARLRRQLGWSS